MDLDQKMTLKRRFKALDVNGDGVLDIEELKKMLTGGQRGMTREDIRVLFKAVDKDRSGYVEFDEFVDFVFEPPLTGKAPGMWFDAAFSGDWESLNELAKEGIEIDARDSRESIHRPCSAAMTAAMYAAMAGRSKCLQELADLSCNLNAQDTMLGKTAVMLAAEEGHHECLLILAESGASLDTGDVSGLTAAMLCAIQGQALCLRLLVKRKADLDIQDAKGWTAAMHAARCGNAHCLELIAKAGADLDHINDEGKTAAILAVEAGDELCVRILAMHGVDLLVKDHVGDTALMQAARLEQNLCARLLRRHTRGASRLGLLFLNHAADSEAETEASSELFDAVWYGQQASLRELVDQDNLSRAKAVDGWSATMVAALRGHEACLEMLLALNADLDERDFEGFTATMLAAMKGHTPCVKMLAACQADLNAANNAGFTAATLAARSGHAACVGLLGSLGADLNAKPESGRTTAMLLLLKKEQIFSLEPDATQDLCDGLLSEDTDSPSGWQSDAGSPLAEFSDLEESKNTCSSGLWFRAAAHGIHRALSQLIEQRANINAFGDRGMTAMMLAAESGDLPSMKLLVNARGDANMRDQRCERTAMSFSANGGHYACIRLLVDEGEALVDARDSGGRTPLMEAAFNGHEKVVRLLARRGANVDIQDDRMSCPTALAAAQGHLECIRVLAEHGADLVTKNRDGSMSNVLHLIEQKHNLVTANSIVGNLNWNVAASGGSSKMCDALQTSGLSDKSHAAALHLNLWKQDQWNCLHARDRGLTEALFNCLQELLVSCRDRMLTSGDKQTLALLLSSGLLRAVKNELPPQYGASLMELNSEILNKLERALRERQDDLRSVAALTSEPDVYFPRFNRYHEKVQGKLDQRDAMPQKLWKWLEELPDDCFQRLELVFRVFRMLNLALAPSFFATYLRSHGLHTDNALYAKAAAHILVGYAAIVEEHFEKLMTDVFGNRFKPAPIKKLPRICSKMTGDMPDLADEALAAEDADLRCAYFALGDAVRGSVWADGPREMISTVEKLRSLDRMSEFGRFDVWRIKNTHHERAKEMTGGYRDVKVLGRFRAKQKKRGAFKLPIAMVVEIQVIDAVYLDIKQYMHKAYAIDRGDFD